MFGSFDKGKQIPFPGWHAAISVWFGWNADM